MRTFLIHKQKTILTMKTYRIRYKNPRGYLLTMMVVANDNQSAIEQLHLSSNGVDAVEIVEVREW